MPTDQQSTIKDDVKAFILGKFDPHNEHSNLANDTNLSGIVSSFGLLELVSHLEDTYDIEISDTELRFENFDTLDKIESFITAQTAG